MPHESYLSIMKLVYKEQYLIDLYEGKTADKRFKSNPQLIRQYIKTIDKLYAVDKIEHLYQIKTLGYSKKQGTLNGKSAVYINKQFRLIFEEIHADEPPHEVVILSIESISKHYEDL